jgi:hypothetical protein
MAASPVQICNSALIKVGADTIISLSDNNKRASVCNHQYPILRDEVLRSHPWNFAVQTGTLGEITPAPTVGDYSNWFQLPSNCLRVLAVVEPQDAAWEKQGDRILINSSTCHIEFIKQETDTTIFDKNFEEALSYRIASDLAWSLTQNAALAEKMLEMYEMMLRQARSFDAQEKSVRQVKTSTWLNSRY